MNDRESNRVSESQLPVDRKESNREKRERES